MLNNFKHFANHPLRLVKRVLFALFLLIALIVAGLILGLRYSVLPEIEQYHTDIAEAVSKAVGQTVEIGKIEADWWGIGPHLRLTNIRLLDKEKRTSLALQRVDVVVSWKTLLTGELRLASLEIDQPDLMIKRDVNGNIKISGVQLEDGGTNNNFANMLLDQSRIVVRGAHISWLDEIQHKPLLVFDDVNLLIENHWNYHRFAMRGLPPAELSTKLDLRGDLYGKNFDDMQSWSGVIFTQLDYADLTAWKTWLPLPRSFKQGRGALRGWLGINEGKVNQVTADLALLNVQTRLADDLSPLDIRNLSGRMGWLDLPDGFELSLSNFSLKLFDGFVLKPTDVLLKLGNFQQKNPATGELKANLLELEGLKKLMDYLPLERSLKNQVAEYLPKGKIDNLNAEWQFGNDKKLHYKVQGKFSDLSLQRVGNVPGFTGLSGELDGNESRGTLSVYTKKLSVDAPLYMPEILDFDALSAQMAWRSNSRGMEVVLRNFSANNADISATAYGSYQTLADSPGKIDLNVHMNHAAVPHVGKYIPLLALGDKTRKWLAQSLLAGESNDFNLKLKGELNDFPFADNRKGIFKINARVNDSTLKYDQDWPQIDNINAELLIHGRELSVLVTSGKSAGVQLQSVKVNVPDLLSDDLMLKISGEAKAANKRALEFIQASPVRGYLGNFTDGMTASGNGILGLKLDIPLQGMQKTKVAGNYHFIDSEVNLGESIPTVNKVNGDLVFTESSVSTQNIAGKILGGPAKLIITSEADGKININLNGHADFSALSRENPRPVFKKFAGGADWNALIDVQDGKSKVLITSSLLGLQSDLPAPLSKLASKAIPLRVEINDIAADQKMLTVKYGSLLNANLLQQKDEDNTWNVERGMINFGNVAHKADRDGIWVIGTLPQVSMEGWADLAGEFGQENDSASIRIAGADFAIQKLSGYGNLVHDLHIKANTRNNLLSAQLTSKELNGDLNWQYSSGRKGDYGHLYARFKNIDLGLDNSDGTGKTDIVETQPAKYQQKSSDLTQLPAVDLAIEHLSNKGAQLGKLEVQGQQDGDVYQFSRLQLSNADGVLRADGKWNQAVDSEDTHMNFKFEFNNAGNILSRAGFPSSVKNGSGKMEGSITWPGKPWSYSMAGLNGKLSLDASKGQFLQIDPGLGKLLSILSLQALPKHITLDFEDVFSKGFEFDKFKGEAAIKAGVMMTDDLRIEGSAAKVFMSGKIDLAGETQDLRVRIVPTVGNSAALISALVATPIMGAYVYLASKLFNDPLGQLVSFEYKIDGSWTDPKVEKISSSKKPVAAEQNNQ
jgi:uncharacterized protein (TIGR02099 family)